jgi:hypothetical protein
MPDTPHNPFADPTNADTVEDGTELSNLGGEQNSTAYLEARNQQLTESLTRTNEQLTRSRRSVKALSSASGALCLSSLFSAAWLIAVSATSDDNRQTADCACPTIRAIFTPTISGNGPISTLEGIVWGRSEDSGFYPAITSSDDHSQSSETASKSTMITVYTPDGGSSKILIPSETEVPKVLRPGE